MDIGHAAHDVHGWRRGMRWVGRGFLGLVALVVLAILGVVVFFHTDYGRNRVRGIGNDQLASLFTGGGSIGALEGTPFGELVLRDVVINGPDGKPAITVKTLRVSVSIFDLVHHDVKLNRVLAEDVEVAVKRDADGSFELARLLKPVQAEHAKENVKHPEQSSWNVNLEHVAIVRGHVSIDTGQRDLGHVNLDDVVVAASGELHSSGTRTAELRLGATWRERGATLTILGAVHDDRERTMAPHLAISLGGVSIAASNLALVKSLPGKLPGFTGRLVVTAPASAVAALAPRLAPPGDVALDLEAGGASNSVIPIAITGSVGAATLHGHVGADLEHGRVTGTLETNEVDAARLTHGKVIASGALAATFDIARGADGALPTATATITGHGSYDDLPRAELHATVKSHGQQLAGTVEISGPTRAKLEAAVTRDGKRLRLDRARLVASIANAMRASGGRAPLHGALDVKLDARGELAPRADLAVTGAIAGTHLRVGDLSAASLALSIDATHLPAQPHGHAAIKLTDVMRGEMQLGELDVDAHDRSDGKVAVRVTSRPKQAPWLIQLAALVTPPGHGDTVTVELRHHRIRAGNGVDWTGRGGRVVIDPRRIAVTGIETQSRDGRLAIDGTMQRGGAGNATATVDVDKLALAVFGNRYRGTVAAHIAVTRQGGLLAGTVELAGHGLAADPTKPAVDVHAHVVARPGAVDLTASADGAEGTRLGQASVKLSLAAPRDLANVAAWKRAGRDTIQQATLAVHGVDLAQVAQLAARTVDRTVRAPPYLPIIGHVYGYTRPGQASPVTVVELPIGGTLDGQLVLTPATVKGDFKVHGLQAPEVRGLGTVDAELAIDQPARQRIVPVLTVTSRQLGTVTARAELALPEHPLDPAAWRRQGLRTVHAATLRTANVAIDPAMLERFGIHALLHGRADVSVEIGDGLGTVAVTANITELRGSPIAQPIDAHLQARFEHGRAHATLAVATVSPSGKPGVPGREIPLLAIEGAAPLSIDQLRADPTALLRAPLTARIELEQTSAPALLAVFGRSEIIGGDVSGTIDIHGTVEHPVVKARLAARELASRPGLFGRTIPVLRQLTLDGTYGPGGGRITLVGDEDSGGTLNLVAELGPGSLAGASAKLTVKQFDLAPLATFAPDPASGASGILDANLTIKGFDPRTSQIVGDLHLQRARVPIAPAIGTLRRGDIRIAITDRELRIAAKGKLGKGDLTLDGTIALAGFALDRGQVKLLLHHVSPIGALEPSIDADVTVALRRRDATWIAGVTVDHGFVKIDKASGEALKPIGPPHDLHIGYGEAPPQLRPTATGNRPDAAPPPARPGLVAHVTLHPIEVESEQFRTTLHGTLDVTADASSVGVIGTVEASSGDLDLFGRRYRIEHAAAIFDGTTDPRIAVRITHDFPSVETITQVSGRLSKPRLELSSDTGLYSRQQLLGFLLGGEPGGDPSSAGARDLAASVGTSIVSNQLSGYIRKALPFDLDVLKYEAASSSSSAAITVGTWVTHTVFVAFTQHVAPRPDENASQGTLEYWFTRRLELEATVGDRSYDGLDLLWRKRY